MFGFRSSSASSLAFYHSCQISLSLFPLISPILCFIGKWVSDLIWIMRLVSETGTMNYIGSNVDVVVGVMSWLSFIPTSFKLSSLLLDAPHGRASKSMSIGFMVNGDSLLDLILQSGIRTYQETLSAWLLLWSLWSIESFTQPDWSWIHLLLTQQRQSGLALDGAREPSDMSTRSLLSAPHLSLHLRSLWSSSMGPRTHLKPFTPPSNPPLWVPSPLPQSIITLHSTKPRPVTHALLGTHHCLAFQSIERIPDRNLDRWSISTFVRSSLYKLILTFTSLGLDRIRYLYGRLGYRVGSKHLSWRNPLRPSSIKVWCQPLWSPVRWSVFKTIRRSLISSLPLRTGGMDLLCYCLFDYGQVPRP